MKRVVHHIIRIGRSVYMRSCFICFFFFPTSVQLAYSYIIPPIPFVAFSFGFGLFFCCLGWVGFTGFTFLFIYFLVFIPLLFSFSFLLLLAWVFTFTFTFSFLFCFCFVHWPYILGTGCSFFLSFFVYLFFHNIAYILILSSFSFFFYL